MKLTALALSLALAGAIANPAAAQLVRKQPSRGTTPRFTSC
jgi:hypothetical protein